MDFTAPARKSVVKDIWVNHSIPGDPLHPTWLEDDTWTVWVSAQTGFLPLSHHCFDFPSEEEAKKFLNACPIGSDFNVSPQAYPDQAHELQSQIEELIDLCSPGARDFEVGEERSPLALDVLEASGVMANLTVSGVVQDFLGEDRVNSLKKQYHNNWEVAAALQYCWLKLPHSSAAYVAARYLFHFYILGDDFTAGYHWRDLEILAYQVEADAAVGQGIRRAARAGGHARAASAKEGRDKILRAMEALVAEGKSVSSAAAIVANRGLGASGSANRKLWDRHKTGT